MEHITSIIPRLTGNSDIVSLVSLSTFYKYVFRSEYEKVIAVLESGFYTFEIDKTINEKTKRNCLMVCVENNDIEMLKLLFIHLGNQMDINNPGIEEFDETEENVIIYKTLLYRACELGFRKIVEFLLRRKKKNLIDVHKGYRERNFINENYIILKSPLFISAEMGFVEIVKLLLKHNANINNGLFSITENDTEEKLNVQTEKSPLFIAVEKSKKKVVEVLLNNKKVKADFGMKRYIFKKDLRIGKRRITFFTKKRKSGKTKKFEVNDEPIVKRNFIEKAFRVLSFASSGDNTKPNDEVQEIIFGKEEKEWGNEKKREHKKKKEENEKKKEGKSIKKLKVNLNIEIEGEVNTDSEPIRNLKRFLDGEISPIEKAFYNYDFYIMRLLISKKTLQKKHSKKEKKTVIKDVKSLLMCVNNLYKKISYSGDGLKVEYEKALSLFSETLKKFSDTEQLIKSSLEKIIDDAGKRVASLKNGEFKFDGEWIDNHFFYGSLYQMKRKKWNLIYFGHFNENNQKDGLNGRLFKNGKQIFAGEFKEDQKHGLGIEYDPNGKVKVRGMYENGKLQRELHIYKEIDNFKKLETKYRNLILEIEESEGVEKFILNKGSFGIIYKVSDLLVFKKFNDNMKLEEKKREIEMNCVLQKNNPHIIRIDQVSLEENPIGILMERCVVNLKKLIINVNKKKANLNNFAKFQIILEIVLGMEFVHSLGVLHRDLKLGNVMIDLRGFIKLIDFGLAKELDFKKSDFAGTRQYLAPETIEDGTYSSKTDIFAFGVIVYQLIFEKVLDVEGAKKNISDRINKGMKIIMDEYDDEMKWLVEIMLKCLKLSPNDRPSFGNILDDINKNLPTLITNRSNLLTITNVDDDDPSKKLFDSIISKKNNELIDKSKQILIKNSLIEKLRSVIGEQQNEIRDIKRRSIDKAMLQRARSYDHLHVEGEERDLVERERSLRKELEAKYANMEKKYKSKLKKLNQKLKEKDQKIKRMSQCFTSLKTLNRQTNY